MITGNGYTLRPIEYADKDFVIQTLLDFPVKPMTVAQAENEFSNMEYVSRGFNESGIVSGTEVCLLLEHGGEPVSFRLTRFKNRSAEMAVLARHPSKRGSGHQDADSFLHGWWYFDQLGCNNCWFEAVDTPAVNGAAQKWRDNTAAKEKRRPSRFDKRKMLRSVRITDAEYRAILAASPTWSAVTFART